MPKIPEWSVSLTFSAMPVKGGRARACDREEECVHAWGDAWSHGPAGRPLARQQGEAYSGVAAVTAYR